MSSPDSEAETVADRRAARQANQTTFNLVLALVASLAVVLLLVLVVVRPEMTPVTVDYRPVGLRAESVDSRFVVPDLPAEWTANRSEVVGNPPDGVVRWETGLLTPAGDFIMLVEGLEANDSWIAGQVLDARPDDSILIEGRSWDVYDRRDVADPGNRAYILVTTADDLTVVLFGTAADSEFQLVATAIAEELR